MTDDAATRRAFWTRQMEDAYAFMQAVTTHPVADCGEPLVSLERAAQATGVEVEFSARPHVSGLPRLYLLRAGLIEPFLSAARGMLARGWVMRVEDGFRTRAMQRQLALQPYTFDLILERVLWELDGAPLTPGFVARRVSALIAASPKIGTHMAGSAIDISVLNRATRREVDRAAPYLELSELTPMVTPFITPTAQTNRAAITGLMAQHGFMAYPWEFWHYNSGDVHVAVLHRLAAPGRYGPVDVDLATGQVAPILNPTQNLNSLADIQSTLDAALSRRAARRD